MTYKKVVYLCELLIHLYAKINSIEMKIFYNTSSKYSVNNLIFIFCLFFLLTTANVKAQVDHSNTDTLPAIHKKFFFVKPQLDHQYKGTLHYVEGYYWVGSGVLSIVGGFYIAAVISPYTPKEVQAVLIGTPIVAGIAQCVIGNAFFRRGDEWGYSVKVNGKPYQGILHKTRGVIYILSGGINLIYGISLKNKYPDTTSQTDKNNAEVLYILGAINIAIGIPMFYRGIEWKKYSLILDQNGLGINYKF